MKRTIALFCCLLFVFVLLAAPASAASRWTDIMDVVCVQGCTIGLRIDGTLLYAGDPGIPAAQDVAGWTDIEWIETQDGGRYLVGHRANGQVFLTQLVDTETFYGSWFDQSDVSGWTDVWKVVIRGEQCLGLRYDGGWYTVSIGDDAYAAACETNSWPALADIDTDGLLILGLDENGTVYASDPEWLLEGSNYWGGGSENMSDWRNVSAIYCSGCGYYAIRPDTVLGLNYPGWDKVSALYIATDSVFGLRSDGTVAADFWGDSYTGDYRLKQVGSWKNIVSLGFDGWWRYVPVGLRADGTIAAVTTYDGTEPYGQWDFRGWSNISELFSGSGYTIGLCPDGSVFATGGEFDYLDYIWEVARWRDIQWIYPAEGEYTDHIVGLRTDGTLVAAGDNSLGQCNIY